MTTPTPDAICDFLHELDGWERAYPLSVFPEPDMAKAAELLKAGGMTLDAISASNMRHVVSQIAPKARAAIERLQAVPAASEVGETFTLDEIEKAYEAWQAGDVPQSFPDMMRESGWFMAGKQRPALKASGEE